MSGTNPLQSYKANLFLSSHCSSASLFCVFLIPRSKHQYQHLLLNIKILRAFWADTFISKSFDNGTLIAYSAAAEIAKTVAVLFLLNVIAPFIKSKITLTAQKQQRAAWRKESGIPHSAVRSVPDDAAAAGVLEHAVIHGEHTVHHHMGLGRRVAGRPARPSGRLRRCRARHPGQKAQGPRHVPAPTAPPLAGNAEMFGRASSARLYTGSLQPQQAPSPHHLTQKTRIAARNLRRAPRRGRKRPRPYSSWHRAFAAPRRSRTARRNSR